MIFTLVLKSALVYAQDNLVFSAVERTHTAKFVGETLRKAYQNIGIRIEIIEFPGERGLKYAHEGETDGVLFRTQEIEKKYTNLERINVPVRVDEMYLFVKRGNEFPVEGWESISEETVIGYQRGVKFVQNNSEKSGIKTYPVTSSVQLFKMLNYGRVDAIISGSTAGSRLIKEYDCQDIVRLDPPIHTSVLYHYLHKRHAYLVPKITAVMNEMKERGEFQMIEEINDLNQ